jgi:ribonucleoside-triphosphate reductase (thioredoxin)
MESLMNKIEVATILGTMQSTLTHFPYLRKQWTKNTEEERLLGVSLTGIYDNKMLNDYKDKSLPARLQELRQLTVDTNKRWSDFIGVEQSTSITAVKPSGTISELCGSASGIHPRHDSFYYRRIRNNKVDPVTNFLIGLGVEHEDDVMNPATVVFTFPKKAPEGSKLKSDISAIDHLELWLVYQDNYCEHKPSVTVSVKEEEWLEVGAWCYRNFDKLSGVSFLPYDGGTYRQAPYESVDETKYNELLAKTPAKIDWNLLKEEQDQTTGSQELACSSSQGCGI